MNRIRESVADFPSYSQRERVADGCIHVLGVTASLVGLTALLVIGIRSQLLPWVLSLTIYGLALVATFSFSAGYHLVARPRVKEVLRRLDHAAIFLMIAGTYTPFILIKMQTPWGFALLAVVWTMAAIGIAIKLFLPRFLDGLSTALYLVQGWAVLAAWEKPIQTIGDVLNANETRLNAAKTITPALLYDVFMTLVPLASSGTRGRLSQRSTPCTSRCARCMS